MHCMQPTDLSWVPFAGLHATPIRRRDFATAAPATASNCQSISGLSAPAITLRLNSMISLKQPTALTAGKSCPQRSVRVLKLLGTAKVCNSKGPKVTHAVHRTPGLNILIERNNLHTCLAAATTTVEVEQVLQRGATMGGEKPAKCRQSTAYRQAGQALGVSELLRGVDVALD